MTDTVVPSTSGPRGWTFAKGAAPAGITSTSTPLRIGTVALNVRDLDRVSRFYQDVIGLAGVEFAEGHHKLGVGETVLLELIHVPTAKLAHPTEAGLYHTAFLLPTRADLARWVLHAAQGGAQLQGASDHGVSEALYLSDPEGNGIEVYQDRPSDQWSWRDGAVNMFTDRLDLQDLAAAAGTTPWAGAPEGTVVGHVHLQVGDTAQAEAFYADLLGLDVVARVPSASFYSSGGYHHHIATNAWRSAGAGLRSDGMTGLRGFELVPATAEDAADLRARALAMTARDWSGGLEVADPWGTRVMLRTA